MQNPPEGHSVGTSVGIEGHNAGCEEVWRCFLLGREEKPHRRCKPIRRPPSEPIPCPRKGCFCPRWSQVCRIGVIWERKLGLCQYTSVRSWAGEGWLGPGGAWDIADGRSVLRESHAPSWLWGCRAVPGPSRTEAYMLSRVLFIGNGAGSK